MGGNCVIDASPQDPEGSHLDPTPPTYKFEMQQEAKRAHSNSALCFTTHWHVRTSHLGARHHPRATRGRPIAIDHVKRTARTLMSGAQKEAPGLPKDAGGDKVGSPTFPHQGDTPWTCRFPPLDQRMENRSLRLLRQSQRCNRSNNVGPNSAGIAPSLATNGSFCRSQPRNSRILPGFGRTRPRFGRPNSIQSGRISAEAKPNLSDPPTDGQCPATCLPRSFRKDNFLAGAPDRTPLMTCKNS